MVLCAALKDMTPRKILRHCFLDWHFFQLAVLHVISLGNILLSNFTLFLLFILMYVYLAIYCNTRETS